MTTYGGQKLCHKCHRVHSGLCDETIKVNQNSEIDSKETIKANQNAHWYCFSFSGNMIEGGHICNACSYVGYPKKYVTMDMINENKTYAKVTQEAVLISCSYLGYMSKEQFMG